MADEITVDRTTLKALGADTRVMILKQLAQRRMTQAELAAQLGIAAPSVNEHLHRLEEAELVKLADAGGRKWKYYELTEKGAAIVRPSPVKKILLVLGLVLLAFTFYALQSGGLGQKMFTDVGAPASINHPAADASNLGQKALASPGAGVEESPPAPPVESTAAQENPPQPSATAPSAQAIGSGSWRLKPGDQVAVGDKTLRLLSISPIATGSGAEPSASMELLDANGNRIDYFTMDKDSAAYQKNGVYVGVTNVFVGGGDSSYAEVAAKPS